MGVIKMAASGSLGVERARESVRESVRVVFLSPLAAAPFLLVAKSPPKWLPQKTPGRAWSLAWA